VREQVTQNAHSQVRGLLECRDQQKERERSGCTCDKAGEGAGSPALFAEPAAPHLAHRERFHIDETVDQMLSRARLIAGAEREPTTIARVGQISSLCRVEKEGDAQQDDKRRGM
jgi:hypothetical protein